MTEFPFLPTSATRGKPQAGVGNARFLQGIYVDHCLYMAADSARKNEFANIEEVDGGLLLTGSKGQKVFVPFSNISSMSYL